MGSVGLHVVVFLDLTARLYTFTELAYYTIFSHVPIAPLIECDTICLVSFD